MVGLGPRLVVTIGALVALVGSFLPWLSSGSAPRSSYELFDIVERLGFSTDGAAGWALRLWPLVPLLLVSSIVLWWVHLRRPWLRRVAAAIPLAAGLYVGGTALALLTAPDIELFRVRAGSVVTLVGGAVLLAGVLWSLVPRRRAREV